MAKTPPPPDKPENRRDQAESQAPNHEVKTEKQTKIPTGQDPLGLLIELATDDNVETSDGIEVKVADVRNSSENALLTRNEMHRYDQYKREWAASLANPQESLKALALREKQIIDAAQKHDWDALDKLKEQVDADIERMKYIFASLAKEAGAN